MRHVLLSICLTVAAFSAPTALDLRANGNSVITQLYSIDRVSGPSI